MTLKSVLLWVLESGGAGVVAWWLMERVPFLVRLKLALKRLAAWMLTGALAAAAFFGLGYLANLWYGVNGPPTTVLGWFEAVFFVVSLAIGFNQGVHGIKSLKR